MRREHSHRRTAGTLKMASIKMQVGNVGCLAVHVVCSDQWYEKWRGDDQNPQVFTEPLEHIFTGIRRYKAVGILCTYQFQLNTQDMQQRKHLDAIAIVRIISFLSPIPYCWFMRNRSASPQSFPVESILRPTWVMKIFFNCCCRRKRRTREYLKSDSISSGMCIRFPRFY